MAEAKMCVVGLIGKSQLLQNQTKAWKLNSLLQKDFFKVVFFEFSFHFV